MTPKAAPRTFSREVAWSSECSGKSAAQVQSQRVRMPQSLQEQIARNRPPLLRDCFQGNAPACVMSLRFLAPLQLDAGAHTLPASGVSMRRNAL